MDGNKRAKEKKKAAGQWVYHIDGISDNDLSQLVSDQGG